MLFLLERCTDQGYPCVCVCICVPALTQELAGFVERDWDGRKAVNWATMLCERTQPYGLWGRSWRMVVIPPKPPRQFYQKSPLGYLENMLEGLNATRTLCFSLLPHTIYLRGGPKEWFPYKCIMLKHSSLLSEPCHLFPLCIRALAKTSLCSLWVLRRYLNVLMMPPVGGRSCTLKFT